MADVQAERMADNEAVFRDANERIQARARELDFEHAVPFLCECGDPACHEILRLTLISYEAVRAGPMRFFVAPGHEGFGGANERVVDQGAGFLVVEKIGARGDAAE